MTSWRSTPPANVALQGNCTGDRPGVSWPRINPHPPGEPMFKSVIVLLSGMMLALPLAAAEPVAAPANEGENIEQALVQFRNDLQAAETEVISKAISLSADEATAFWPIFKKFQGEQRSVIDNQIAAVRKYAEDFATLNDEDAQAYVN